MYNDDDYDYETFYNESNDIYRSTGQYPDRREEFSMYFRTKECRVCGRILELVDFHVNNKSSDSKSGKCAECTQDSYSRKCTVCDGAFKTGFFHAVFCSHKCREIQHNNGARKRCSDCGVIKSLLDFGKDKSCNDYRKYECKDCTNKNRIQYDVECRQCHSVFITYNKGAMFCCSKCYGKSETKIVELSCNYCETKFERTPAVASLSDNHYCNAKCFGLGTRNPNLTDEDRQDRRLDPRYREWRSGVLSRDRYKCSACGDKGSDNLNAHHINGYNWAKDERYDIRNGDTLCKGCHVAFHKEYGYGDNTEEQYVLFIKGDKIVPLHADCL